MFALWYGTLFYKEYRDAILNTLSKPKKQPPTKETAVVSPSRIPIPDPNSLSRTPSPQQKIPVSLPTPQNDPPRNLEPPQKPPRSPSPHPMRTEAFEEIQYEEEEDDDEEDDEEEDLSTEGEEEQNSVISSPVHLNNSVNDSR